jgi:CBS domain-containing protein
MSDLGTLTLRQAPLIGENDKVRAAVQRVVASGLPALPVVGLNNTYRGIFGEREFISALFPGYVGELRSVRFVPREIDAYLARQSGCGDDLVLKYTNTEHIDVGESFSDIQLAEIFIHHRVLIIPIVSSDRVVQGVITRSDFFRALVERFQELT